MLYNTILILMPATAFCTINVHIHLNENLNEVELKHRYESNEPATLNDFDFFELDIEILKNKIKNESQLQLGDIVIPYDRRLTLNNEYISDARPLRKVIGVDTSTRIQSIFCEANNVKPVELLNIDLKDSNLLKLQELKLVQEWVHRIGNNEMKALTFFNVEFERHSQDETFLFPIRINENTLKTSLISSDVLYNGSASDYLRQFDSFLMPRRKLYEKFLLEFYETLQGEIYFPIKNSNKRVYKLDIDDAFKILNLKSKRTSTKNVSVGVELTTTFRVNDNNGKLIHTYDSADPEC